MRAIVATAALACAVLPHAHADPCEVRFVRAPDDVRLVIERWVRNEPRCTGEIELRVIETGRGSYYLVAQRPGGRIHEREVPDADAAGVLVASWVADRWSPAPIASVVVGSRAPTLAAAAVSPEERSERWITLSPMFAVDGREGRRARVEIDVFANAHWGLGVSFAYGSYSYPGEPSIMLPPTVYEANETRLTAYLSRTFELGTDWRLRAAFGAGLNLNSYRYTANAELEPGIYYRATSPGSNRGATVEASLLVERALAERWAVTAGPMVGLTDRDFDRKWRSLADSFGEVWFLLGLRYRL